MHIGTADQINLIADEDGYELHITNMDGDKFTINVHGSTHDLIAVGVALQAYWREGAQMAQEYEAEHGAIDRDAYDRTSPKHPDYHATMSALADDLR